MTYDSRPETYEHIRLVQHHLNEVIRLLLERAEQHDASKLKPPELAVFDEATPKLRDLLYGSDEYRAALKDMRVGLDHHYAVNSHHPEHFVDGILGMTLLDLTELICDWMAATQRMEGGDIIKSLEVNQKRFGYGDELARVLLNTVRILT